VKGTSTHCSYGHEKVMWGSSMKCKTCQLINQRIRRERKRDTAPDVIESTPIPDVVVALIHKPWSNVA